MVRALGAARGCIGPGPEAGFMGPQRSVQRPPGAHPESETLTVPGSWVPTEAQMDDLLRVSDGK